MATNSTVQHHLNTANPANLPAYLRKIAEASRNSSVENPTSDYDSTGPKVERGFGDILASLIPRSRTRATLTSQAAHVHDVASTIHSVESPAGTPLAIVSAAPDAGEVQISYDENGRATLTFNAAVTTYTTTEGGPLPEGLASVLASRP